MLFKLGKLIDIQNLLSVYRAQYFAILFAQDQHDGNSEQPLDYYYNTCFFNLAAESMSKKAYWL